MKKTEKLQLKKEKLQIKKVADKIACITSVSVELGSKERPRNGTGTVFCPREIGARAETRKRNPTETLAAQATVTRLWHHSCMQWKSPALSLLYTLKHAFKRMMNQNTRPDNH